MAQEKKQYVVGIDLGGTKIYAAVVNKKGKIIGAARKKTKHELGFAVTVERMAKTVQEALENAKMTLADIKAVGVGSPGPLDLDEGIVIDTPNLKWKNAPLRQELAKLLKKPIAIDNDGNVGLLGEWAYGAAKKAKHAIGLFVGTGIGGGVIINGKLLHGFNQNAGELGHIILDPNGPLCGCGNKGCMEAFASRLAIERDIRAAIATGKPSQLNLDVEESKELLRSRRIAEAYLAGDQAVVAAVEKSATYLGYGVASLLNIFNPEVVVIGGGVVEAIGQPYVKIVKETAIRNCFKIASRKVRIVPAALKDDSAVLGAAMLAWKLSGKK